MSFDEVDEAVFFVSVVVDLPSDFLVVDSVSEDVLELMLPLESVA